MESCVYMCVLVLLWMLQCIVQDPTERVMLSSRELVMSRDASMIPASLAAMPRDKSRVTSQSVNKHKANL